MVWAAYPKPGPKVSPRFVLVLLCRKPSRSGGRSVCMKTTRPMTKSPLALARTALATAKIALLPYSSRFSRHDYTQHQLFALLSLREFLKVDYRGLEQILREWVELRNTLGLKKVPDHSTLQKAATRLLEKSDCIKSQGRPRRRAALPVRPISAASPIRAAKADRSGPQRWR